MFSHLDSGWFLWTLIVVLTFLPSALVMRYMVPPSTWAWYRTYASPNTPSSSTFGMVWFILYGLEIPGMALFWRDHPSNNTLWAVGVIFGGLNMLSNALGPISLFGKRNVDEALLFVAFSLVCATIAMSMAYASASYVAAGLLTPQVVWLLFAAFLQYEFTLNFAIGESRRNRTVVAREEEQMVTPSGAPLL